MRRAIVFLALCAALQAGGGVRAATGDRPDALDAFDKLLGTWQSTGTFVESAYSQAGSSTARTTCVWSSDRLFLICQQNVVLGGAPSHDVAIYTYDDAKRAYRFYNVGVNRSGGTELKVDAASITYDGSFDDGGRHVLTRTTNVWESPKAYAWRAEYSLDGGAHWTLMGSGRSVQVSPP